MSAEAPDSARAAGSPSAARLRDRLPRPGELASEAAFDRFLAWVADLGLALYPAQEQALLELWAGKHVVLSTPTGSGKSLVALALHWKALCEGRRSFYTAPVKALASEKFFALCDELGAENVGMLTGDASINWAAPVVCCTAEVLSNMALRRGEAADAPYVVMDEFHFYADPERGVAWQVPLLALPRTTFLLMSATLGNTAPIEERLARRTGRAVAHVHADERPVPLEYEWRETPLHETVEDLLARGRAPVYVVHFTQREAADRAQALTSTPVATREQRQAIAEAIAGFRFDSPYGKDVSRILRHGIGLHHAGLLPRYRLLVEQLAQRGLLRVVCGTDTLGVGVNIPIRTVLFSSLVKFDGERTRVLSVRDFRQIAGRAGRKGFDERGWVACQAPEHVIENRRLEERAGAARRKAAKKRPPPGFVAWTRDTFERLVGSPPEMLVSRFRVTYGMVVSLLQRGEETGVRGSGYRLAIALVEAAHEDARHRRVLRRDAARIFRSLRRAGLVQRVFDAEQAGSVVRVSPDLQRDFSLHQSLSLYLVDAVPLLDRDSPEYARDVLSLAEAILEDPRPILQQQVQRARQELLARLKAEGVPYEERVARLEEVTYPQPAAEFIRASFAFFCERHPWLAEEPVRPKSVAREMWEGYEDFDHYVRRYGLQRSEGVLLRYLSQLYNAVARSVPESARDEELWDAIGFFRALLARVDSSLVEEWEERVGPGRAAGPAVAPPPPQPYDLARHPRALAARLRAELHQLVRALAARDFEAAAGCVRQDAEDGWDAARFEAALAPFFAEHERVVSEPRARTADKTLVKPTAPRRWDVHQVLCDPAGEDLWQVEGEVDLTTDRAPAGPLVRLRRIGP
jgi:superfamily II RNA helicase